MSLWLIGVKSIREQSISVNIKYEPSCKEAGLLCSFSYYSDYLPDKQLRRGNVNFDLQCGSDIDIALGGGENIAVQG